MKHVLGFLVANEQHLVSVALASWWRRTHADSMQHQFEVIVADQQRAFQTASSRRRALSAAALDRLVGCHSGKVGEVRESFLAWAYARQLARIERTRAVAGGKAVCKYSEFVTRLQLRHANDVVKEACFSQLVRNASFARHSRGLEWVARRQTRDGSRILQLEEELRTAYMRLDHAAEALQRELQGKEQLAVELRSAYGRLRLTTTPDELHAAPPLDASLEDVTMEVVAHSRRHSIGNRPSWDDVAARTVADFSARSRGGGLVSPALAWPGEDELQSVSRASEGRPG